MEPFVRAPSFTFISYGDTNEIVRTGFSGSTVPFNKLSNCTRPTERSRVCYRGPRSQFIKPEERTGRFDKIKSKRQRNVYVGRQRR